MLVSQLALASQVPITPLLLQAATIPSAALLRSSLVRRNRHLQQTRNFRFSLWTSYIDPEFQKELQRRNRIIKHKYAEALNRKLSWDWKHSIQSHHRGFKGFVCGGWRGQDPRPGGRWVDVSELKNVTEGSRAGHGIEDVEQAALEKLWAKESRAQLENAINEYTFKFRQWAIPTSGPVTPETPGKPAQNKAQESEAQSSSDKTPVSELEYDIDPISNRKVFRKAAVQESGRYSASEFPKVIDDSRSQPSTSELPAVSAESTVIHLDGQPSSTPSHISASTAPTEEVSSLDNPTPEELDAYKPFKYNEPDGQTQTQSLTYVEEYEDLDGYKPFKYNEPNGQLPQKQNIAAERPFSHGFLNSEECGHSPNLTQFSKTQKSARSTAEVDKSEDLDLLRASDIRASSGIMKGPRKQADAEIQATRRKLEDDFDNDQRNNEASESEITSAQEFRKDYARNLEKQRLEKLRSDRLKFQVGLNDLKTLTTRARFLIHKKLDQLQFDYAMAPDRILETKRNQVIERVADELVRSGEIGSDVFPSHSSDEYKRLALERWIRDAVAEKENKMFRAQAAPETPRKMTGNFVRDFPEEFATSWTTEGSTSDSLVPRATKSDAGMEDKPKLSQSELSFRQNSGNTSATRIQTSLDRTEISNNEPPAAKPAAAAAPDTQEVKDTQKQRDKALIREVRDIYESRYGTIDCEHRQISEDRKLQAAATDNADPAAGADKVRMINDSRAQYANALASKGVLDEHITFTPPPPAPTIYKILAYDPVMQAINIAETTSIVPDISSALTPADVLLRLSNPAKFFPHFHPLQSQGYEIVSGSGDVLVFRKVRDGGPPTISRASTSQLNTEVNLTNPIDGMQTIRPATGNFASPTGFVNHDLPEESPSEAPFKSNIDVRREEDVFSGRNSGWQEGAGRSGRKGWRTVKRVLAGAGTVAASSYAIGVVIEYFRTGGVDGKGPEGL